MLATWRDGGDVCPRRQGVGSYLAHDVDVLLPLLEVCQGRVKLGSGAFKGEDAVVSENVVEVAGVPDVGS